MTVITRRHAITTTTALLSSLTLPGCSRLPDTFKIGVAQPLSGDIAALGQDMLNGVLLAVNELNAQGFKVNNQLIKLEVVAQDDKIGKDGAIQAAQKLVEAGVVAVVGHLNSGDSIPAAPIYAAKGIAQLAISTNPKFCELGLSTTFRLVANDTKQARAVGSFAAGSQIGKTKFAVVDDGSVYGKGLAEASVKLLSKPVVFSQSFDNTTKDFAALADKLKVEGVEVVISTLNDFQVIALIDALAANGYGKQVIILGTDTLKTGEILKHADKVFALYATSPVLDVTDFPQTSNAFLSAYKAAFKTMPEYAGHYSYDAVWVLSKAIMNAASASPAKITEALHAINGYAPVTGSMRWTDKGEQQYGVVGVYAARAGRWESMIRSDQW
jgi:branched-chain amino acid transport system substrate-binding protein